ncbi:1-hydroxycarotenoid 3,4-desaturase CrtD [Erythrobacter sp.]|uniref:1-hydroxycarotenoid 3,4-desaturase CrtD n=1 Tax=Erythrobacter sp. TaxID=1042 RepID=UPI002EB75D94|nr:phytoene desaturase family protein [Erythrobacter sp.]
MTGHIVVIGAGIGGLACAARLAARGYDVSVFEKEPHVGGKARRVSVGECEVDGGPTVFTMRDVFDGLFRECGARLEDFVHLSRAEVLARHAWDDGARLDLFADPVRSEEAIADFAGADAAAGYRRFRGDTRRIHDILDKPMMRGANVSSPLPLLWRIGWWRLGDFAAMRPHQSMWSALGDYFPDPRLRQLFARYSTYCGSSPFEAPATLMLIAHVEQAGVWLIDGGIHALADAMRRLGEARGVRFHTGTPVAEVLAESGRRVSGVRLADGSQVAADAVICNADPGAIAGGQLGDEVARSVRPLPPAKRSLSAMVWYAHAATDGPPLSHHNVFFSADYAREFEEIAAGRTPSSPSVYMCAQDRPARLKPAAGETTLVGERERIQIIVNAPADGDTNTYSSEEKERCTAQMKATLRRCGLELEADAPLEVASPVHWERLFPGTGGALYGRASHGSAASFLRQGPRTRMAGLYCAGGATHPSAGVPMAALSGLLAAKVLDADLASTAKSNRAAMPGGMSMRSARTGATP